MLFRMKSLFLLSLFLGSVCLAEEARKIADVLRPVIGQHRLAGAVTLVADKDRVLALDAVGLADIAAGRPMTTDAVFWIASMSKPMTAAAFMMLVDEGKVSVDDPVEKYLPEFKGQMVVAGKDAGRFLLKKPRHPILVRNVLSHTSGLDFKIAPRGSDARRTAARSRRAELRRVLLAVRTRFRLQILQCRHQHRGADHRSRLRHELRGFHAERLFDPLGMKDTTFWPDARLAGRIATSYKPNAAKDGIEATPVTQLKYPLSDRASRYPMPAGGLFSTAGDVAKFCQLLLNRGEFQGRRLISAASVGRMTSRQTPADLKESYGFGFAVTPDGFGHGGAYGTNMNIDPRRGIITVWMVQNSGFPKDWANGLVLFKQWAERRFGN